MKINEERLRAVLSSIGMRFEKNSLDYPESDFTRYVSSEYRNSKRHETDEIYRMYEPTLLHNGTGLRIVYTTTESYFGDSVDYKVIGMFILTLSKKKLEIVDVDFNKEVFVTTDGNVPFGDVDKGAE